jgi:hypothetical protein
MNRRTYSAWFHGVFSEEPEPAFRSRICAEVAWEASRVEQAVVLCWRWYAVVNFVFPKRGPRSHVHVLLNPYTKS